MRIIKYLKKWIAEKVQQQHKEVPISVSELMTRCNPFLVKGDNQKCWYIKYGDIELYIGTTNSAIVLRYEVAKDYVVSYITGEDTVLVTFNDKNKSYRTNLNLSELNGIDFSYVLQKDELTYIRLLA